MLLKKIYTAYGFLVFSLTFLLFFPLLLIPILLPRLYRLTGVFNRWWATVFFVLCLKPYKVERRGWYDKKRQYIFCPNHFSYLDIPTLGFTPINAVFFGKSSLEKVPVFGWMYRRLHITVDRDNLRSRGNSLKQSLLALDEGKSLIIYPEGGIFTKEPPKMVSFKDGAFRAALEKQIPIVPVTIPYNWQIFPDDEFLLRRGTSKVVFHEPISVEGKTLDDIKWLKEEVYNVIDQELGKHGG